MAGPLDLDVQLYVNGAWTSFPAYTEEGWSYKVGRPDQGPRPSSFSVTLADDLLDLDPDNPTGQYYQAIGLNTPARLIIEGLQVACGDVSKWEPFRSDDHVPGVRGRAGVNITAEGIRRRLDKWDDPIESAYSTHILSTYRDYLLGFWTMEETDGAAVFSQRAAVGGPANYSGDVSLAAGDGPGGANPVAELGTGGAYGGAFGRLGPGSDDYQVCFSARLSQAPASGSYLPLIGWFDTLGRTWWWNVSNANMQIECRGDGSAGTVLSFAVGNGGIDLTVPTRYRVKIFSGTVVTVQIAWYQQDGAVIYGTSDSLLSSTLAGRPTTWFVRDNTWVNGGSVSHVFAINDPSADLTGSADAVAAYNGYPRERAAHRFGRLCEQQGVPYEILGDPDLTAPMGRQRPGTFLELLETCVATDDALWFDSAVQMQTTMRTWDDCTNQTPALELIRGTTPSAGNVAPPLRRTTSDYGVANDITLQNADGVKAHRVATAGRKSVLPPPDGVYRIKGGAGLPINYADPWRVEHRASYELAKGTLDRPRYESVTVDLVANPELRAAVAGLTPGDWLTLTGEEADTITFRALAWERTGGAVDDRVRFTTDPAEPYMVPEVGEARVQPQSLTLAADATSTATALTVQSPYQADTVSTTADAFDVVVSGERITVTAASAAALVSGAWTQTLTVTRSVNGVVKALSAGVPVELADRPMIGLG